MVAADLALYPPHRQHRAVAMGRRGAIASQSPLASAAGLRILQEGGNAVDAAIAIAAVECVALPMLCGLGGDTFAIVHAPDGRVQALNSSGAAPLALTAEEFRRRGLTLPPFRGAESAAVPGSVAAWEALCNSFGTMPLSALLAPAIWYAEHGVPVDERQAEVIALVAPTLQQEALRVYLPRGRPPLPGELLVQPAVAAALRAIAEGGAAAFYRGPLAEAMVADLQRGGSRYTLADFAAHRAEVLAPLRGRYRGYEIVQTPPVSQGAVMIEALHLLDGFELAGPLDPRTLHLQVEAIRLAFADRRQYLGDPRMTAFDVAALLSPQFAARRRAAIDPHRAGSGAPAGPFDFGGDTTSFVVADATGWGVSFIHSISSAGGAGALAGGILLNNRLGRGFTLEPGHPNELAPGKRTMHTLNCYAVLKDGVLRYLGGTPGGDGQPQWNLQVICNLIDFGMTVQEAAEWPRWMVAPATDPVTLDDPPRLDLDGRYPAEVVDALGRLGHPVRHVAPWDPGRVGAAVQLLHCDPERGVLSAGSDPRGAGQAVVW
ncbi:MAG: gamma-glutamyltransferase family protein [Chloroflexota bacterium]|nr:gamma-glutamyltransferase family protein [Dehalococcoidia bacterium]MDW8252372.1 gamma-glutamyltransferase family protein [Chloroflexota bacterium]